MRTPRLLILALAFQAILRLRAQTATQVWSVRYDGPNGSDFAVATAVDSAGNVVVTGGSEGIGGGADFYTAKYAAADGALLWEKRYNGPANGEDCAAAIVADTAGNVVVTGISYNANADADYYTAKYASADGALLWEKRYDGPANHHDSAYSVAVDSAGNVIVTGESEGDPASPGRIRYAYTAKYASANGALLWERGTSELFDDAYGVAVDSAGNVFVAGETSVGSINGISDYYTAKYASANGTRLWGKRYNGPANWSDFARSIAVDRAGNVVVTGESEGLGSGSDYYTAKYAAADGALLWEARYNGPANSEDYMDAFPYAGKLALTPDGGAVVTGRSRSAALGDYDYATVRYAPPAGDADGDGLQDWWERMWWGTTDGHSALDDFDHDGIPELLEMAFDLNPKQSDNNALPQPFVEGGYLTMSFTKHPGVTYQVQSAGTPDASAFTAATTTVLVDNATTLKVRDNFPLPTNPARYLRVKVTAAP